MSGVDDLELVGGAFGAGAKIRVQIEDLLGLAAACRQAEAEIDAGHLRVLGLLGAADAELMRSSLLVPIWTGVMSHGAMTAVRDAFDDSAGLRELARSLRAAAGSYEEVERRNAMWDRVGDIGRTMAFIGTTGLAVLDAAAAGESPKRIVHQARSTFIADPDLQKGAINTLDSALTAADAVKDSDVLISLFWAGTSHLVAKSDVDTVGSVTGLASAYAFGASLYRDRPAAIGPRQDLTARPAPQGLADLYASIDRLEPGEAANPVGRVVVQQLHTTGSDGVEKDTYIVSLPGTSDTELPSHDDDDDIRDINAIGRGLSGARSAEVDALPDALEKAGVPAAATIALVGHSLGGINAARAAGDPKMRARYDIKHVLTAGSPIQRIHVPQSTRVVSLVNRADIVPKGAAAPDPDTASRATLRFTGTHEPHGMTTYEKAARALDERVARIHAEGARDDTDRGYRDIDESLRRDGFLGRPGDMVSVTRVELQYGDAPPSPAPVSTPTPHPRPAPTPPPPVPADPSPSAAPASPK